MQPDALSRAGLRQEGEVPLPRPDRTRPKKKERPPDVRARPMRRRSLPSAAKRRPALRTCARTQPGRGSERASSARQAPLHRGIDPWARVVLSWKLLQSTRTRESGARGKRGIRARSILFLSGGPRGRRARARDPLREARSRHCRARGRRGLRVPESESRGLPGMRLQVLSRAREPSTPPRGRDAVGQESPRKPPLPHRARLHLAPRDSPRIRNRERWQGRTGLRGRSQLAVVVENSMTKGRLADAVAFCPLSRVTLVGDSLVLSRGREQASGPRQELANSRAGIEKNVRTGGLKCSLE